MQYNSYNIDMNNKTMHPTNNLPIPFQLLTCVQGDYKAHTVSILLCFESGKIEINERCMHLQSGNSILMRKGTQFKIQPKTNKIYLLHLESEVFDTIMMSQLADCKIIYDFLTLKDTNGDYLFFDYGRRSMQADSGRNLLHQCSVIDNFSDKLMRCCLVQYLTNLQRDFVHHLVVSQSTMMSHHPFGQVLKYIGENYADIDLKRAASHFSYNPDYFSVYFHHHAGVTFTQKLFEIRLEQALRYLTLTDMSVNEICETIGFKEKSYFIRRFKQQFNCTPSQYRKKHRD